MSPSYEISRTIADGTPIHIRAIRPSDKANLSAGLSALSEVSRQRRFLSPKPRFTSAELRYLTEVDGLDHVALVAMTAARRGVGVARYVRLAEDPSTAEVAIAVADELQGRGLGSLLADELVHIASANGIQRFSADMLSDNIPAQRLMAHLTRRLERHHDGAGHLAVLASLAA